jgi:hypothetical protein
MRTTHRHRAAAPDHAEDGIGLVVDELPTRGRQRNNPRQFQEEYEMSTGQVKGTLPFTGFATLPLAVIGLAISGAGVVMTKMRPARKTV